VPGFTAWRERKNGSQNGRAPASIERLSGREAFMELVSSSFQLDIADKATLKRHFRFIEQLVEQVTVRRLRIPDDLSYLPTVREAVLADVERA
jgi:hypothetical protein